VLALGAEVERVCWYTVTDYPNFLHDKEDAFGLFRYQPAPAAGALDPKPAFVAAATLACLLGRTRFARDLRQELGLPPEAYALCFLDRRRHQTVIVFWATAEGVPVSTRLAAHVRGLRLVTMDGAETDLGRPRDVALTLGPDPVYLMLAE
jgi:hypothetical protein